MAQDLSRNEKKIFQTLFLCGLSERFLPQLTETLTEAIYSNLFDEVHLGRYDINYLVIAFKGLVLTEAKLIKKMNSAAPAKGFEYFLRNRLSPFLYNELAIWTLRNSMGNLIQYRPQPYVLHWQLDGECAACDFFNSVAEIARTYSFEELWAAEKERQDHLFFETNKCPTCGEHIVKNYETRWGSVKACGNYPVCSYIKRN